MDGGGALDAGGSSLLSVSVVGSGRLVAGPNESGDIAFTVTNDGGLGASLTGFSGLTNGFVFVDGGCVPTATLGSGESCQVVIRFATSLFGPLSTSFVVNSTAGAVQSPTVTAERYAVLRPEVPGAQSVTLNDYDGGQAAVAGGALPLRVGPRTTLTAGDRPGCTFAAQPTLELLDGGANTLGAAFDGGCQWQRRCELTFPRPAELTLRGAGTATFVRCTENVMFVSTNSLDGYQVGAQADALCRAEAADAGMLSASAFVALRSVDGGPLTHRLSPSAAWLRPDGVPVAMTRLELFMPSMRAPLNVRADGQRVGQTLVWAGRLDGGAVGCVNSGVQGQAFVLGPEAGDATELLCGDTAPVYCAHPGSAQALPSLGVPDGGRLVFMGPLFAGNGGYPTAVQACQTAGLAARPGRTFRPLLFVDGGIVLPAGGAWHRPDGVVVFGGRAFLDGGMPLMRVPVHQRADATFALGSDAWLGSATQNCAGWSAVAGNPPSSFPVHQGYQGPALLGGTPCNSMARLICLEE